jgi:hypothetical protein
VARAAALGLRDGARVRVVTLATPHGADAGAPAPPAGRLRLLSIYSLHDALVTPPERAYVSGAFNVAVRDDGHFGIVRSPRTAEILREALFGADDASAVAS